ncbi:MAG: ATP-dependent helicase [Saprospiraceae bacterium]|nr:ATP-dependent helicase [Saprospiraceae bacterium]
MTIQTNNEQFLRELERLNPAQREAVETIEGPVLVIAGPGTGKTHILAARIGNILLKTDAQPHNILCLTFTDAGVQAMRQRLLSLIGPDVHKVHIFTFHSFCNTIIQDNLDLFGRRETEPLSDLERVETLRQLLDELPWTHPLRRGRSDGYRYEQHLQELFRRMKSENWTPTFVEEKIDAYLTDLPARKEFIYQQNRGTWKKGDLKTAAIEDEKLKMERLRSAVKLFPRYEEILRERRRYDYEDMILWVLRAFREHPYLLARYQEQYLYFLLDEYQDTNGAQNEILQGLTEYWDAPNIFIVGDDDQSIYEFQGARLKNITDFYHTHHDDLKVVVLTENYRSTQHILDSAGTLIATNTLRIVNNLKDLGLEKILTARHPDYAQLSILPSVNAYPNRLQEEVAIAEQLENLMNEGFPLDEVAVIFAKHRQAKRLMSLLEKKGIPYQTRQSINALDLPLVQNLRLMLGYFVDEFHRPFSGEQALFRMLHFEFFGIKPQDIARLSVNAGRWTVDGGRQTADGDSVSVARPWRQLISDKNFLETAGVENPNAFSQLSDFVEFMLGEYANLSVPHFIERLINRSGLLRHVLASDRKAELLQVLFAFTNFIENEALRNPRLHLTRLLEVFASMDANRIQLAVRQLASGSSTVRQLAVGSLPSDSNPSNNSNSSNNSNQAVQLLTAHSSKGLEFRHVFLLDCVKDNWEPAKRGGQFQFSFPDTLHLSGEADALEARRRLFYVAMTRAKERLHISYATQGDDGKALMRTQFLDEIMGNGKGASPLGAGTGIEERPGSVSPMAILEAQAALLLESKPTEGIGTHDRAAVQALLEKFTLSVTAMNKFLRCPLSFYYENVLRAPAVATEAAFYGVAMHNALRRGFDQVLRAAPGNRHFPFAGEFVQFFEHEMRRQQGFLSKKDFERRLDLGRQYLADYVRHHQANWTLNCKVEQEFNNVVVDGVPIMGILDRIDYLGKSGQEAHIVDYKTGGVDPERLRRPNFELAVRQLAVGSQSDSQLVQQSSDSSKLHDPQSEIRNPKSEIGGAYWRQLVFYKILFDNWRRNTARAVSAEISYLEPDARGNFETKRIEYQPEDVVFVKGLITDTYARIMRQEFYVGCGQEDCSWCRFLKAQQQVDSFADVEGEELDD